VSQHARHFLVIGAAHRSMVAALADAEHLFDLRRTSGQSRTLWVGV
jgi:hypothetical protein